MSDELIKLFDREDNPNVPELRSGDYVTVHLLVKEGKRERIQLVRGVIMRLHGSGNNRRFTVRRIASNGVGVERSFLTHSPLLKKIEIHRHSHVRRAQLYFLRDRRGKAARLQEKGH